MLNTRQQDALRAIGESGSGVRINRSTATALERRGFVTITGAAWDGGGAICRLTDEGLDTAIELWGVYHAERIEREQNSTLALRTIERLTAKRDRRARGES